MCVWGGGGANDIDTYDMNDMGVAADRSLENDHLLIYPALCHPHCWVWGMVILNVHMVL